MHESERFRGCLLGLTVGDAVGTTVEFKPRGSFPPVTDMVGGGPFGLKPGEWTDDTSMALCLATSLVETGGFDPADQMDRYCLWRDEGYLSSNGGCFDIGGTVAAALRRYKQTGEPYSGSTSANAAGNGSIMRLAPVPMFFWPDRAAAIQYAGMSSRTTHACTECIDACRLLASVLVHALDGSPKETVLLNHDDLGDLAPSIAAIARGGYRNKAASQVRGSGYVVASLEAALWCFDTTASFQEAILKAANLGDDADTTAAVCGQIAGALYGEHGIPEPWRRRVARRDLIVGLAEHIGGFRSYESADAPA